MSTYKKPTEYFNEDLAELLSAKIENVHPDFHSHSFIEAVANNCADKSLKHRVELISDQLYQYLPDNYKTSASILVNILGPENEEETGMFTNFYWVMPIAKYIEKYGLTDFTTSIAAIEEITKRNTGEYAIRPFIKKYPERTLEQMRAWATSENFHLRRLASEGLRPKLPWASKLDLFITNPEPVFSILNLLKEDPIHFVKKSVGNHLRDYVKVNQKEVSKLIEEWKTSTNQHTKWIIKHALR